MLDTLLEMRGITKIYSNGFVANKDINFSVAEGKFMRLWVKTVQENPPL